MITLDPRVGSGDLKPALKRRGVPCELQTLHFGDASWFGQGKGEFPVHVGVEIKKVSDVLQCIHDGRFAGHQLPGLVRMYDVVWLVIEGGYRPGKTGVLELPSWSGKRPGWRTYGQVTGSTREFMWESLEHWISTMVYRAGIRVRKTHTRDETAAWLASEYRWWQGKWESHESHLAIHAGRDVGIGDGVSDLFWKPNLVGQVAAVLPGIGYKRARAVQRRFKTVADMLAAKEEEWQEVEGVGKVVASNVVKALGRRAAIVDIDHGTKTVTIR